MMHSSIVEQVWYNLHAGEVRLAICADVDGALAEFANLSREELAGGRVVSLAWKFLPIHTDILEETIDQLAKAALAIWPNWFSTDVEAIENKLGSGAPLEAMFVRVRQAALEQSVLHHWLTLADRACQTGRTPRWPANFTVEVEARHLTLALGGQACRLVLAVRDGEQDSAARLGLARAAEWLARATKVPTLVLAPPEVARSPELDSISFGAVDIAVDTDDGLKSLAREAEILAQNAQIKYREQKLERVKCSRLVVSPLVGKPHPDSTGEQLLWERLQADPELHGLFLCNQWTSTECDTTHLVDFVWRDGKLIVEVDGYYWHSSRFSFSRDRRRDYELHLSGYLVVRLPHDEVVEDVDAAVEKIRRMVHYRRRT